MGLLVYAPRERRTLVAGRRLVLIRGLVLAIAALAAVDRAARWQPMA